MALCKYLVLVLLSESFQVSLSQCQNSFTFHHLFGGYWKCQEKMQPSKFLLHTELQSSAHLSHFSCHPQVRPASAARLSMGTAISAVPVCTMDVAVAASLSLSDALCSLWDSGKKAEEYKSERKGHKNTDLWHQSVVGLTLTRMWPIGLHYNVLQGQDMQPYKDEKILMSLQQLYQSVLLPLCNSLSLYYHNCGCFFQLALLPPTH